MSFWTIKVDISSEDVGNVFPQVHCLTQGYAHKLSSHSFPNFQPKLDFLLEPRAKFSDIIGDASISATGLLISEKFKDILEEFNLANHRFYRANIKDQKEKEQRPYYWLHLYIPESTGWINYESSKFFYTEYGFREGDVEITSFEDSKIKKNELVGNMGTIEADSIVLNEKFNTNLDLFALQYFNWEVHISKRLKNEIMDSGLKGLEIQKSICSQ